MQERTIIFGAPGCGKTYYLLNLLEDLLKTYKPHEIAFVSFTRKGAYEGRNKAMERFGIQRRRLSLLQDTAFDCVCRGTADKGRCDRQEELQGVCQMP